MSQATVYSAAQYGLATETTATGLLVGSISYNATSDTATAPNHIGCDVGIAIYNARTDVSCDGVVAAKGTAIPAAIGETLTLANSALNTRARISEGLGESPVANSTLIVTGVNLTTGATSFESGSITAILYPSIATNSAVTLT